MSKNNPTIPIKTFSLSNIKKKDDKVKVIKNDLIQVKDLSDIDTELEESKKKIEDLKENLKQYMKINLLLTQQKKEVESDLQKEEKRIKKEKINRQTLPSLQGNLLLSKNHIKTKIIPKKVSKPSRIRIVSTIVWIFSKKPNNT